ncbi:STY4528 family pathogenicity island replication protein [Serratia microhaemolytica]|uniref:STY4528 family pathogenicity island replication protein n=1 Tax=Serratia microhaemolytica TaxID=2675110 RepID=UPI000FDD9343|nr:STY4528 family pathogenicity island replication protein [Serratia microhaemolytica]
MALPTEGLIAYTLEKMNARLVAAPREDGRIRSGLLFTGNVHDAIPRRLLLDTQLSPLDKMAWMMIRLYAQNNEGAIFPRYDELQQQLASPGKGKASRETVSRVLLMLRLTGWLSLCKQVRDEKGRVRGNIYAQHDEPLTFRDAETFDPHYVDMLTKACLSKNRTISQTAQRLLEEIKNDPTMRHYHSHLALIESRLDRPQNSQQMATRLAVYQTNEADEPEEPALESVLSSETELGENAAQTLSSDPELSQESIKSDQKKLGSETELSHPLLSSETELSHPLLSSETEQTKDSISYPRVRDPNHYVRNITHSVIKNTYVAGEGELVLPDSAKAVITDHDQAMLLAQLRALPVAQAQQILAMLANQQVLNPVGWLLSMMKKAREGKLNPVRNLNKSSEPSPTQYPEQRPFVAQKSEAPPISEEAVRGYLKQIREQLSSRGNK